MRHGSQARQHAGGMDENVQLLVPREDCSAQGVDASAVREIQRDERWRQSAKTADLIIQLFQRPLGAANGHDPSPCRGQSHGARTPNTPGRPGHHGHAAGQPSVHW